MKNRVGWQKGFTIVELLIVIVIIAILAAITIVAYNGMQERARNTKISADLSNLKKAITAARMNNDSTFGAVTGSMGSTDACAPLATGTDLASLSKTSNCWVDYKNGLAAISAKSGVNVNNLVDPWGRPYYVDENENPTGACGGRDVIATFKYPFVTDWAHDNEIQLPYYRSDC